jgi:prepilin-type processing-associated H-X9-DG protein
MFGYAPGTAGCATNDACDSATLNKLNKPADDIMYVESHCDDIYKATGHSNWNASGINMCSQVVNWDEWGCGGIGQPPDPGVGGSEDQFQPPYGNSVDGMVSATHSNKTANFAFADGHVKAMKPYLTNMSDATSMWNIAH